MRTASACSCSSASTSASKPTDSLPHGEVCVRSMRSPDKETDERRLGRDHSARRRLARARRRRRRRRFRRGPRSVERGRAHAVARADEVCRDETQQLRPAILDAVEEANKAVLGLARGAATTLVVAQLDATRLRSYHVGDSELLGRRAARPHQAARRAAFADGVRRRSRSARRERSRAARSAPRAVQRDRLVGHARRGRACAAACGARHGAARERRPVRQPLHRRDRRQRFAAVR